MRNQDYQNKYDDRWSSQRNNNHSYYKNSSGYLTQKTIKFCQYCGERISIPSDTQNVQRQNENNNRRLYSNTYPNSFSSSSTFMPLLVIITLVIIIASCGAISSFSTDYNNLPISENIDIGYKNPASEPAASNIDYQISEQALPTEESFLDSSQANQLVIRTYMVQAGDTVYRIAVSMLGDGNRWVEIAQLNNLERLPNGSVLIRPGQELLLPNK